MKVGDLVLCKNVSGMPPSLVIGTIESSTGMILYDVLVRGRTHLFGRSQLQLLSKSKKRNK